jgi:hypothetical protein
VFLIYPIALLIAIFNAHFLYDASLVINHSEEAFHASTLGKVNPIGHRPLATNSGNQIGFQLPYMESTESDKMHTFDSFNPDQFKADILHEMQSLFAQQNAHRTKSETAKHTPVSVANNPPIEHRFTSDRQPKKQAPKKHGQRVEGNESRIAILAAYRSLKDAKKKPTHQRIADITGISRNTVGKHVRELKREKLI